MADPGRTRLSCNITRAQERVLREHARGKGSSITSAVEAAVTELMLIDGAQDRGAKIIVREADGETREVIFV